MSCRVGLSKKQRRAQHNWALADEKTSLRLFLPPTVRHEERSHPGLQHRLQLPMQQPRGQQAAQDAALRQQVHVLRQGVWALDLNLHPGLGGSLKAVSRLPNRPAPAQVRQVSRVASPASARLDALLR